jgi:hypothetical protein
MDLNVGRLVNKNIGAFFVPRDDVNGCDKSYLSTIASIFRGRRLVWSLALSVAYGRFHQPPPSAWNSAAVSE